MKVEANHVFTQVLVVSKRSLKDRAKRGEASQLRRPTYVLTIKSHHSPDHAVTGGGNYAILSITIPKGTAEALVQDHGAKWDDTTLGKMG